MRKLILLTVLVILSSSLASAKVGLAFGLNNSNLAGNNVTAPSIGIPIEINNLIIEPNITFYSMRVEAEEPLIEQATIFGIGGNLLYRMSNKKTRPMIGGGFKYFSQTSDIESIGSSNDTELSQSRYLLMGIAGIEHNIDENFSIAIQASLEYSYFGDIEYGETRVIAEHSNYGLGIAAVLRMYID